MEIEYTSWLPLAQRENLEALLYFNEMQHRFFESIEKAVDEFGSPRVEEKDGALRIEVSGAPSQSLFATRDDTKEVIGVVIFIADTPETFMVLHFAVAPEFNHTGEYADMALPYELIRRVIISARKVGKKEVRLAYRAHDNIISLKV